VRIGRLPALLLAALPATAATPPWARTETREPCASYADLRQPFFGDLHVHTRFSADAYIFGTRVGPRDAYDFARGGTIPVSDENELETRTATIDRPLDFTAVTDHAELFGEVDRCIMPGSPAIDEFLCRLLRQVEGSGNEEGDATVNWLFPLGIPNPPTEHEFCTIPGVDCDAAAVSVWQEMQAAAEEAYDRTAACTFTSFVGYEHTPSPLGRHRHRNVVFKNHVVPPIALSHLDTLDGGVPQGLWNALEAQCTGAGTGCDAIVIPHNSNLSGGEQFVDPLDGADALRRQTFEPLVEIHQVKGNSECRFDKIAGIGVGTEDELCTFEQDPLPFQGPFATKLPIPDYFRRNLVRPTLLDGLGFEETLGANPFRMGFVGSTDTHNANAGDVDERDWAGAQGQGDASPVGQIRSNLDTNPGGLAGVWAEENSRDALFAALRRRETFATSGTRPVVRFFAGTLDGVRCDDPEFVARAYATGTPMGGELGTVRGKKSPRFAVWAMKDPGTATAPGTDLQRIQIVKGWVDADGVTHERVVDVAGDAANGAGVDPATCEPTGSGAAELCAVWEDPEFDPAERAFYYARVLENPVCRWSTRVCKQAGIDPFAPDCAAQAASQPDLADCCLPGPGHPFLSPTIQERAWTSPIWYRPDTIGRLRARLAFGTRPGRDRLVLRAELAAGPRFLSPVTDGLSLRVRDDDDVFVLDVPGSGFRRRGSRATYKDPATGTTLVVTIGKTRGRIALAVRRADLAAAARETHAMTIEVESGTYRAAHTRPWRLRGRSLAPEGR
jgi:hypothetical protein